MYTRPRFSPGYGDLPINMQKDIFAALDCPRKIGLSLNESLLMSPSKSVTAIIGVSARPKQGRAPETPAAEPEQRAAEPEQRAEGHGQKTAGHDRKSTGHGQNTGGCASCAKSDCIFRKE